MPFSARRALSVLVACVLVACSPSASSTSTPPAAGTGAAPASTSPQTLASGATEGAATAASGAAGQTGNPPEIKPSDCPPRCSESGAWVGCGLEKPRGKGCGGCVPKCKSKGSASEGWYDCTGVFIATAMCAS